MRIVGGRFRGRTIAAPPDMRIRPTGDRVRESLFNVLSHNGFGRGFALEGLRVIDLFAGTGALGLEAISRGAAFCLFVDDHPESRALIRENVESLNLTGVTKIWRRDAGALGPRAGNAPERFALAFMDPPYRKGLVNAALAGLRDGQWLAPGAIAVAETAADEDAPQAEGFILLDERLFGETRVSILGAGEGPG